jgi:hypothetical protein
VNFSLRALENHFCVDLCISSMPARIYRSGRLDCSVWEPSLLPLDFPNVNFGFTGESQGDPQPIGRCYRKISGSLKRGSDRNFASDTNCPRRDLIEKGMRNQMNSDSKMGEAGSG